MALAQALRAMLYRPPVTVHPTAKISTALLNRKRPKVI
jgi:hypothetical protein